MRKTSKDTGDTTSINSGVDNDIRKSDISSKKRNSIKKKVQNFVNESDDAALVPLLQTYKDKTEHDIKNSKYAMSKTKSDSLTEKELKKMNEEVEKGSTGPSTVSKQGTPSTIIHELGKKTDAIVVCNPVAIQNHMNTNVFGNMISSSCVSTPKTSFLIEINEKKSAGFSATPLIFTTAKIHTDSKTKTMEPLQVTPVPILSTIEGNLVKSEITSYNDSRPNILLGKFENNKSSDSRTATVKDNLQKPHKDENTESSGTGLTSENNQKVANKLSKDKFTDKVHESKTDNISKPLVNTISITLPPLQQNMTSHEKIKTNKEIVTKSDVVKSMDITTSTQNSKEATSDDKISSKLKLESTTNSMKKLQRQKHTSIEETNNTTVSKNEYVHLSNKDSDTKSIKAIDCTPNSNVKTNSSTQLDNKVPAGHTKIVKTCPSTDTDKFTNKTKPSTTIKPIGILEPTKEQLLKSTLVSTSYIDDKTSMITTKSSTTTSVSSANSLTDCKVVTKESLHKSPPVSSSIILTSQLIKSPLIPDAKTDKKLKSPTAPSKVTSPTEVSVICKGSDGIPSLSSNPKTVLSTSINNTSVSTPLYIVATSKTKIGGTSTYNTPGFSKTLIEKSADQVTTSVSISTTAVINKAVNSKSAMDGKTLESKFKK